MLGQHLAAPFLNVTEQHWAGQASPLKTQCEAADA
jgi:hypothetical protein